MDFKFDRLYPPEYAYVEDIVRNAREKIRLVEKLIENLPDEKPLDDQQKSFKPRITEREQLVSFLENAIADFRRETLNEISDQLEQDRVDPKMALWIRQSASFTIDPLPGNEINVEDKRFPVETGREKSQQALDALVPIKATLGKEVSTDKKAGSVEERVSTISARFFQSLSYAKATDKSDMILDAQKIDKDRD